MTFIWLIVWLVMHTPAVHMFGPWNNWGTALAVCVVIDLLGALGARGARSACRPYMHAGGRTWTPRSGWRKGEPDQEREPHDTPR